MDQEEYIEVYGAREHNLKNIDVMIPRNKLVVITGLSGSGKSSLAFDTIYAEGQRRYMETFSAYARSFIGDMERPDVDKITGLSPVISIEQKTTSRNPRSTVGTVTEIYDFLRLMYARAGEAFSYITGNKMIKQSEDQIIEQIIEKYTDKKMLMLAPIVRGRKGHYRELFEQIRKQGFTKVRVNGEIIELSPKMQLDRYRTHNIEILIDRIIPKEDDKFRLAQSVKIAMIHGKGTMILLDEKENVIYYSKNLMDPETGLAYDEPAPNAFSFNSPYGSCPTCNGLGEIEELDIDLIIPDRNCTIKKGGIVPLGDYREVVVFKQIEHILKAYQVTISTPIKDIPEEALHKIMYGTEEIIEVPGKTLGDTWETHYAGILAYVKKLQEMAADKSNKSVEYTKISCCPECNGDRLKKESLFFIIDNKNIAQASRMDISQLAIWLEELESRLSTRQVAIANEIIKEIRKRVDLLLDVGLDYLTLNRSMRTLSGGEAQRIRLATQIGSQLVGVLYILDEPSVGLHQRDNVKLIQALKNLRDIGNTVLVVEHDKDMMLESDYILDIGPGAGRHGGTVVAQGTPTDFLKLNSPTADYLRGVIQIPIPAKRRQGNGKEILLKGAKGNNLKNVNLRLPLGQMICITGVSGSGKSSLIHDTLYPILNTHFFNAKQEPLTYDSIEGLECIDKVIEVNQSPIGRTPRSNPATYTGVFTEIRSLYTQLPEAKIRGYSQGRFSFNVKGGRCEICEGAGMKVVEMEFLPDVLIPCEGCKGKRYNRETLEVRFRGKAISDVLDMTVEQAVDFFENQPKILRKIETLNQVGLGYVTLGQHATTLSGGEAQRVKLATELSKKDTGKTLYILDEPTTGLHFDDIRKLLEILNKLTDKGNTVLIIEHNLDVIKVCDYIIDLGPEGGNGGGQVLCEGTPEDIADFEGGYTAKFLKQELHYNYVG